MNFFRPICLIPHFCGLIILKRLCRIDRRDYWTLIQQATGKDAYSGAAKSRRKGKTVDEDPDAIEAELTMAMA